MTRKRPVHLPWQQEDFDPRDLEMSKAEQKKATERLQELAQYLTTLSQAQLAQLPLSEETQVVISDYKRLPTLEAKRRQLQLINKHLRHEDETALTAALFETLPVKAKATADRWIQRLTAVDGLQQVADFAKQYRTADRHTLMQIRLRLAYAQEHQEQAGIASSLAQLRQYVQHIALSSTATL